MARRHLRPEQQDAITWLQTRLLDGPARSPDLYADAKAAGISEKRLRRIRHRAGVTIRQNGFHAGWTWSLTPEEHARILRRRFHYTQYD